MGQPLHKIPSEQVTIRALALADQNGRLFEWQGTLYRGITLKAASLYRRLLREGIIERLVSQSLLIETQKVPLVLEGYGFVVKHRRVPYVSYAYEWSPQMLKDAALLVLDLNLELTMLPQDHNRLQRNRGSGEFQIPCRDI